MKERVFSLPAGRIFVFGSNLAGRHGRGAALDAVKFFGAIPGEGVGPHGKSYAIPTKDRNLRRLPVSVIWQYVQQFLRHAMLHPNNTFYLTPIGCGLAGYRPADIAPMFRSSPPNVILPEEFIQHLDEP